MRQDLKNLEELSNIQRMGSCLVPFIQATNKVCLKSFEIKAYVGHCPTSMMELFSKNS